MTEDEFFEATGKAFRYPGIGPEPAQPPEDALPARDARRDWRIWGYGFTTGSALMFAAVMLVLR